jgi:hypothetical protein
LRDDDRLVHRLADCEQPNNIGGHEPLLFNPVNAWTATLILAIGLDLGAAHARGAQKSR